MTSTRVHLDWNAVEVELSVAFSDPRSDLVRQIGTGAKEARCPECHSIIYSRRHRLCGVCSQPLPDHLLFTVGQAQSVERLLETERHRHRKWLENRAASAF